MGAAGGARWTHTRQKRVEMLSHVVAQLTQSGTRRAYATLLRVTTCLLTSFSCR